MKQPKTLVGKEVAFNMQPDATWFEVLSVNVYRMTVREAGTNYKPQISDTSLVKQVREKRA